LAFRLLVNVDLQIHVFWLVLLEFQPMLYKDII